MKKILKYNDYKLILEAEGDEELDLGEETTEEEGGEEEEPAAKVDNDIPEKIIDEALRLLTKDIENLFEEPETPTAGIKSPGEEGFEDKIKDKNPRDLTFEEMGVKLMRVKVNNYSRSNRNIDVRFSDSEGNMYSLYIRVNLDEAIPEKEDMEMEPKMVKNAFIKFKKYDTNNDLAGSISRNVEDMWQIGEDEKFLIDLKLEVDGDSPSEEEELVIET
jgi:hypothetical protein